MEQGTKKIIMLVITVVCIVGAVAITIMTHGNEGGIDSIDEDAIVWLLCRNPKCEHAWEMNKREYYEYLDSRKKEMGFTIPGVLCPKCGEESCYRAMKCSKCGFVYERNSVPNDVADRCPECKYSEIEDKKRERGR